MTEKRSWAYRFGQVLGAVTVIAVIAVIAIGVIAFGIAVLG